jgi:hypothetical protein
MANRSQVVFYFCFLCFWVVLMLVIVSFLLISVWLWITALHMASANGHVDVLGYLLDQGAVKSCFYSLGTSYQPIYSMNALIIYYYF